MHELVHVAILASTILGVAALALLVLWPVVFDTPPAGITRVVLGGSIAVAGSLFLLEWRVVH